VSRESEESPVLEGLALLALAMVEMAAGDYNDALRLLHEAQPLVVADRTWAALPPLARAAAALAVDENTEAASAMEEAAHLAQAGSCVWVEGRLDLLRAQLAEGAVAIDSLVDSAVAKAQRAGDRFAVIECLEMLATQAFEYGDDAKGVRLSAASAAGRAALGYAQPGKRVSSQRHRLEFAEQRLGTPRFKSLWTEGEGLTVDAAVAYASRGRGPRRRPATGWPSLTPAEREVVRLVAEHCSNPEIADQLFITRATVKTHLAHIFAKVGVSSRSELAAYAIHRQGG
jgi:DNA-binding CsgD family transcriptional regulator